jgi:sulfopyruvate decarboxylase TPP-binding subunit
MRGEYAEFNPWQVPMARATQTVLESMGMNVMRANHPDEVADTVQAALDSAFDSGEPMAVLLSQRLIGRKKWVADK